jgi:hypothetical protein
MKSGQMAPQDPNNNRWSKHCPSNGRSVPSATLLDLNQQCMSRMTCDEFRTTTVLPQNLTTDHGTEFRTTRAREREI